MALGKNPAKRNTSRDAVGRAAGMLGLKRRDVEQAIAVTSAVVRMELALSGQVRIKHLGTFKLKARAPRMGRHPVTGAPLPIPARTQVHFTAAKPLIDKAD